MAGHEIVTGQHPLSSAATLREFASLAGGSVPRVFITRDLIDALIASSAPSLAACPSSLGVYAFTSAPGYAGDAAPLLRYFPDPLQTTGTVLLHTGADATYTLIDALSLAPLTTGVLSHGARDARYTALQPGWRSLLVLPPIAPASNPHPTSASRSLACRRRGGRPAGGLRQSCQCQ